MSRFASPLVPGQLAGPSQEAVQGIGMAGQFSQQNLERAESGRQANMADATRRAALTQEERSRQAQERQAGLQRSHEQGMQARDLTSRQGLQAQELDARGKLQQEEMVFREQQAKLDRDFQMEMESRVRKARQEDTLLEKEAWLSGVEARAGKRDVARAKRAERQRLEADLAAARIETERGDRDLGDAKTRALEFIDDNFQRGDDATTRGKAAGVNAIAKLGLDASDLRDLGIASETDSMWDLGRKGVDVQAFLDEQRGLRKSANSLGIGGDGDSYGTVKGDVEGAKTKLMRRAAEHIAKSIAAAGGPASAADSDVVDAIHEFMVKATAAKGAEAAGTPVKLDDLKAILDRVGPKVTATELWGAFDGMGEQAEAQAFELKKALLAKQDAKGGVAVTAETIRLALQLQTMEALAGIDNAANLALGGKVDHPEMWLAMKERLMNRTRPDDLDADSMIELLDVKGGQWKDRISPLVEQGGDLYGLIETAERQKGRMSNVEGMSRRRAEVLPQIEEDLIDMGEDADIEGARAELETLRRLLSGSGR